MLQVLDNAPGEHLGRLEVLEQWAPLPKGQGVEELAVGEGVEPLGGRLQCSASVQMERTGQLTLRRQ